MKNLIRLFQKYSSVFIFLFLQIICFAFLFSGRNSYHHAAFANSSNRLAGGIFEISSSVTEYFHLKKANENLLIQNTLLKEKLEGHNIVVGDVYTKVNDTMYLQQYKYLGAKVIKSTKKFRKNHITINRGSEHQVVSEMGVIGTKGVVGITVSSSRYYSTVIPIINEDFEIAVRHAKSKSFGRLKWTEENTWENATVIDVPIYIDVQKGDAIETRGSDGIFPEGQLIGTVISTHEIPGESYQKIIIDLAEDFSSVYHVQVVKNVLKQEQKKLEEVQ